MSSIAIVTSETTNQSRSVLVCAGRFLSCFAWAILGILNGGATELTASAMYKMRHKAVYYTGIGRTNGGHFHGFRIYEESNTY